MWYVIVDGVQSGPLSEDELLHWAQSGRLGPNDLVWRGGMAGWLPASQSALFSGAPALTAPGSKRLGDDRLLRAILPVGRSGWAIASGYLGLLSVLLVPAPFAIITGIVTIIDIRRHRGKHGMGRAIFGIVMGVGALIFVPWALRIMF
ncbi:MAG: DUF4339 domain-containing protein [Coriobacteriia bacterium]|nr:DUF4339 domain-containing protein [Coriobacteriia bacterium]